MIAARSAFSHAVNGAALMAILAIAAAVVHTAPSRELQQSAVTVPGTMGEAASGRNIRATVTSVTLTESVTAANGWAGSTPGVWLVVQMQVEAVVDDQRATLGTAVLQVGNVTYSASTRPQTGTIAGSRLATGIPVSGPLMFELPTAVAASAAAATAELQFAAKDDPRADSLLVVPVDLSSLDVQTSLDVDKPSWGAR
jgi:hypothetical protein